MPDDNCCPVSLIRLRIELAVLEGSNVSEPVRQGKSFVPPKGAAILMGDPLPGLTAQDFADGLDDSLSDHDLAEAIALVCNKVSHLLHLVEEGEASRDELDEWLVLENKLCQEALERGGSISGEGPGLMGMIAPFMERNGYRDACGWWGCDEGGASQDSAESICPECGASLEGFVEGSSMGQRCTACGWSVVTTYTPPIMEDEREYAIILMPGETPTREALRAISRLAMCNYGEAKRLTENEPTTLFVGRATEVLARKNELEDMGVPIEVRPDFPYDKDGRLADEVRLNTLLLEGFPELTERFEEYTSWQDGMETGCFVTYEDLLLPLAYRALDNRDEALLTRIGTFIEQLMTSGDAYAVNLATVGLIEGLKAYGNSLIRSFLGPVSLEEFDTMVY